MYEFRKLNKQAKIAVATAVGIGGVITTYAIITAINEQKKKDFKTEYEESIEDMLGGDIFNGLEINLDPKVKEDFKNWDDQSDNSQESDEEDDNYGIEEDDVSLRYFPGQAVEIKDEIFSSISSYDDIITSLTSEEPEELMDDFRKIYKPLVDSMGLGVISYQLISVDNLTNAVERLENITKYFEIFRLSYDLDKLNNEEENDLYSSIQRNIGKFITLSKVLIERNKDDAITYEECKELYSSIELKDVVGQDIDRINPIDSSDESQSMIYSPRNPRKRRRR